MSSAFIASGNTHLKTQQETSSTTAAPVTAAACNEVWLQGDSANGSDKILIGDSAGQYVSLAAGIFFPTSIIINNLNKIYFKSSANTPKLNVIYRD